MAYASTLFSTYSFKKKFCKTIVIIREPVSGIKSWILLELTGKKIDHNLNKAFTLEDFFKNR